MIYLVCSIIILGFVAFVIGFVREQRLKIKLQRGEIKEMPNSQQVEDMECCGQHETCEKESLLAALSKEIEYYNDEELDRFRGTEADQYDEAAVEEFREVLYTMKEEEVAGWVRSLRLRAIELPTALNDEVFLIVGELRS